MLGLVYQGGRKDGTTYTPGDLEAKFAEYFLEAGWVVWPEDVAEIWSKESTLHLLRAGVNAYSHSDTITQERGSYRLPDHIIQKFGEYETIYHLNIISMTKTEANSCFER